MVVESAGGFIIPPALEPNPQTPGSAAGGCANKAFHFLHWLKVLLFPFQASISGPGEEPDLIFPVDYFPMLRGVVEFDVAGAVDLQPAEFMERNSLGPKTKGCAVGVE